MDKKEAIQQAAKKLFQERGFRGVSVRDIGAAAGVGASSVSYYFGSKAALYHSIFPEKEGATSDTVMGRIESAAVRLFAAGGYDTVSIRDIAQAAGVNSAAISYYFGGKAELYKRVLYTGTAMISEFIASVEAEKPDPPGIIRLYGQFLIRLGMEKPEVLRLIFWELMHGSDVFGEFVRQRLSGVLDIVRQAVADGIQEGTFRKGLLPEEVCISWSGMILFYFLSHVIHKEISPERALDAEAYMDQTWHIFMNGIGNDESEVRI